MQGEELVCSQCGGHRKNDCYGSRCEDCWAAAMPAKQGGRADMYEREGSRGWHMEHPGVRGCPRVVEMG